MVSEKNSSGVFFTQSFKKVYSVIEFVLEGASNASSALKFISRLLSLVFLSLFGLFLVIKYAQQWITKYKLQYLLRISIVTTIFSAYFVENFPPGWEDASQLSLSRQKSFWSNVFYLFLTVSLVMVCVRYFWGKPINIIKRSTDVGFSHLKHTARCRGRTVRELAEERIRSRDPGQLNPVYVNGWIPLIESSEVAKGQVTSVVAIGNKFAVFRGEDGDVSVMDAYCPHMGADLTAGGIVKENCIECPFHGWTFSGKTGKCTDIPYSKRVLELAKAKVWESCEKNGYIFVWHHAEGEPPTWEIPSIPEIESGEWVYRGRSELTVHCHIQDIPENGADIAHLPQVHSRFVLFGSHLTCPGSDAEIVHHNWEPAWKTDEQEPHIARVHISQNLVFFSTFKTPWTKIDVEIEQIGPAAVHLHMKTSFGNCVFLQYITSEGPLQQRVVHILYTQSSFRQFPANCLIWGEAVMLERDIMVWNNKKFLKNPLLVKEDRLISKFRRWYAQFYSPNSPTLRDVQQRTLDW